MKKRIYAVLLVVVLLVLCLAGCGKKKEKNLEGTCAEILDKVYANADFDQEFRDSMEYYESFTIDEENAEYIIGTADVKYTDSICSVPLMNATPYQCILLRVAEGQDMGQVKKTIEENADPRKWICVQAESTIVDNIGDMVLFIMAEKPIADAVEQSFKALAE